MLVLRMTRMNFLVNRKYATCIRMAAANFYLTVKVSLEEAEAEVSGDSASGIEGEH